jgi:hypothetical protein
MVASYSVEDGPLSSIQQGIVCPWHTPVRRRQRLASVYTTGAALLLWHQCSSKTEVLVVTLMGRLLNSVSSLFSVQRHSGLWALM